MANPIRRSWSAWRRRTLAPPCSRCHRISTATDSSTSSWRGSIRLAGSAPILWLGSRMAPSPSCRWINRTHRWSQRPTSESRISL